jgi:hypothetical protein
MPMVSKNAPSPLHCMLAYDGIYYTLVHTTLHCFRKSCGINPFQLASSAILLKYEKIHTSKVEGEGGG